MPREFPSYQRYLWSYGVFGKTVHRKMWFSGTLYLWVYIVLDKNGSWIANMDIWRHTQGVVNLRLRLKWVRWWSLCVIEDFVFLVWYVYLSSFLDVSLWQENMELHFQDKNNIADVICCLQNLQVIIFSLVVIC